MGRPLNKKYFGNRNIGSASTTADNGIGGEGVASVTLGGTNSGYTAVPTTTVATTPKLPGGVRATIAAVMGITNTAAITIVSGGTLYAAGDVLTVVGLGDGTAATITVATVDAPETGVITGVTLTTAGAYTTVTDLTVLATTTNSVSGSGATVTITDLKIASITVTEKGSGYTGVPAVTISGTATGTAVLTTDSGNVGSATNQENSITMTAFLTGGSAVTVDIIKQVSTNRYKVTDGTRTGIVKLKSSVATAAGEGSVRLVDSDGGTYFATKITAHKAVITRGTGVQAAFPTGASVKWNMTAATADSLLIDNA